MSRARSPDEMRAVPKTTGTTFSIPGTARSASASATVSGRVVPPAAAPIPWVSIFPDVTTRMFVPNCENSDEDRLPRPLAERRQEDDRRDADDDAEDGQRRPEPVGRHGTEGEAEDVGERHVISSRARRPGRAARPAGPAGRRRRDRRRRRRRGPPRPPRPAARSGSPGRGRAGERAAPAREEAEDSSRRREERRLDEEGAQHLPPARAEGLQEADLARPLRHRDEHDVHDPDPRDGQRHRRDAGERRREDPEDLAERLHHGVLRQDRDVLLPVVPVAEHREDPPARPVDVARRAGLAEDAEDGAPVEHPQVVPDRDQDDLVEVEADRDAARDEDARHAELLVAEAEHLAEGRAAREELLRHLRADDADPRRAGRVPRWDEAPFPELSRRTPFHSAVTPATVRSRLRSPKRAVRPPTVRGATEASVETRRRSASTSSRVRSCGTPPTTGTTPVVSARPGRTMTRFVPRRANSPVT